MAIILSFCKQEGRVQRDFKICRKSHREAVVELVPEARSPECHSGSAPSSSPLVPPLGKKERLGPWSDLA